MDPISVLVSLNANYLPQLHVLLTSIYCNNPGEKIDLYLLHSGMEPAQLEQVARRCETYGYALFPISVDREQFADAPVSKRYPPEMYYRLLSSRMLPDGVERILYLDPDVLVLNPLRPLWELDLGGKALAAAAHTGKTELANNVNRLRLGTAHDYYNSGVLLMDVAACRKLMVPEEIFQYVSRHAKELLLPDQDILNALYGSQIYPLDDAVWNYDARNYNTYLVSSSGQRNLRWVMSHTAVLHFCGKAKPWKPGYIYRFGVLYLHYAQITDRLQPRPVPMVQAGETVALD
ncbi:glycosyltransferase family 8 protein [Intestinimonas massiliensis (ex Afouda et al. 2020)]|uniref:glycosyltransferase family 8 protein n=1 Tax=Intestinimonas massiliensis (ex Afouda et al. 2020) TaxID=1673721 RepID=UPI00102FE5DD|nr:glycosyltransferase family 8 protein [Intestinimonas massiliensis (ex Afouda et al. 2020)]